MAEAKEEKKEKKEKKRKAQLRAEAAGKGKGGLAAASPAQMRDPLQFYRLGLAMLLPPGTVPSVNGGGAAVGGSPRPRDVSPLGGAGGSPRGGGGGSLMKRLETAEEAGRESTSTRQSKRQAKRESSAGTNGGGGEIAAEFTDARGQLNLSSEAVIRGCAALLFPGEFVFDPSAETAGKPFPDLSIAGMFY